MQSTQQATIQLRFALPWKTNAVIRHCSHCYSRSNYSLKTRQRENLEAWIKALQIFRCIVWNWDQDIDGIFSRISKPFRDCVQVELKKTNNPWEDYLIYTEDYLYLLFPRWRRAICGAGVSQWNFSGMRVNQCQLLERKADFVKRRFFCLFWLITTVDPNSDLQKNEVIISSFWGRAWSFSSLKLTPWLHSIS